MQLCTSPSACALLPSSTSARIRTVFFSQAEDGIRALYVTGVQTCALPISSPPTESVLLRVGRAELAAAAGQVGGLGGVAGEFDGAVVGLAGLLAAAQA